MYQIVNVIIKTNRIQYKNKDNIKTKTKNMYQPVNVIIKNKYNIKTKTKKCTNLSM